MICVRAVRREGLGAVLTVESSDSSVAVHDDTLLAAEHGVMLADVGDTVFVAAVISISTEGVESCLSADRTLELLLLLLLLL